MAKIDDRRLLKVAEIIDSVELALEPKVWMSRIYSLSFPYRAQCGVDSEMSKTKKLVERW